jgi:hypothetical protein
LSQSPILKALSSIRKSGARTLLIGGQACVFYGAAEFSRDLDLLILSGAGNLRRIPPGMLPVRPAVQAALRGRTDEVAQALEDEQQEQRRRDREYWEPLKRELEQFAPAAKRRCPGRVRGRRLRALGAIRAAPISESSLRWI